MTQPSNRSDFAPAAALGNAILRDVTLRDGLQLTGKLLSTDQKLETVRELLRLGVPAIELGSMARRGPRPHHGQHAGSGPGPHS